MKALILTEEAEELAKRFEDLSLVPIVKDVPYDLESVKKEFLSGFNPAYNIFFTRFSVKMAERLGEFKEKAFQGAVATNSWVLEYLKELGITAELIPKEDVGKFLLRLDTQYAIWCSSVDDPPKVSERGRIFVVHGVREDEEAFKMVADRVNKGAGFIIFTSPEEVYAWEKLEEFYGEAEGLWAIAIGKSVAALIQNHTSIGKVLVFEGKLADLPNFLRLFGMK